MPVAKKIQRYIEKSSWIRAMFEAGIKMKQEFGPENVFDFSLGNPDLPPPEKFKEVLAELARDHTPGLHGYPPNQGWPQAREQVAAWASTEYGVPFTGADIIMTVGAGGGLNVALKTILDPGDQVIALAPYFVEYGFYADNHGGELKVAATNPDFSINLDNIEAAVTDKTRAVLINSPNNPTGAVYPEEDIKALSELLGRISSKNGRTVYLISDEPYRKIVFDGVDVPSVFKHYQNVMCVTSYSKDLSLPGERIGFIAVHPQAEGRKLLVDGLVLNNRILGFVNAPGLMQLAVARLQGVSVDVSIYRRRRDIFVEGLTKAGYELTVPKGAFYLFPARPLPTTSSSYMNCRRRTSWPCPGPASAAPAISG